VSDDYRYSSLRDAALEAMMSHAGYDRSVDGHAREYDRDDPDSQWSILSGYAQSAVEAVVTTLFRWRAMLDAPDDDPDG
jgi:hypothetical protein